MLNTNKIDSLIVFGEKLIQKSSPLDAVLIEDELEELHSYCQEVFSRVARFHHRLVYTRPVRLARLRRYDTRETRFSVLTFRVSSVRSWTTSAISQTETRIWRTR